MMSFEQTTQHRVKLFMPSVLYTLLLSVCRTLSLTVTVNDKDTIKSFFVFQYRLYDPSDQDFHSIYFARDPLYTNDIYVGSTVGWNPEPFELITSSEIQCGSFKCGQFMTPAYSGNFYLATLNQQRIITFTDVAKDAYYALDTQNQCIFDNFQTVASFPTSYPSLTKCTGGTGGDPHFRTWGGLDFDYMGSCDLVLLKDASFLNGLSFRVHIRTIIENWWSFVEKIAFQIGNDIVEIQVSEGKLLWNGNLSADPIVQIGDSVSFTKHEHYNHNTNTLHFSYVMTDSGVDVIHVNGVDGKKQELGIFFVHSSLEMYARSVGMMGTYPTGQMVSREGEDFISDPNAYGENWKVREGIDPQLFQFVPGYPLENCIYPVATDKPKLMTLEQAKNICKNEKNFFNFCIQDMIATGDYEVAEVYENDVFENSEDILLFEAKMACSVAAKYEEYCIKEVLSTKDLSIADEFVDLGTSSYFQ